MGESLREEFLQERGLSGRRRCGGRLASWTGRLASGAARRARPPRPPRLITVRRRRRLRRARLRSTLVHKRWPISLLKRPCIMQPLL